MSHDVFPMNETEYDTAQHVESVLIAYVPLVRSLAARYARTGIVEKDDLVQDGLLALCDGVMHYDRERGPLPAYLRVCVRNRMVSALRKAYRAQSRSDDLSELLDAPGAPHVTEIGFDRIEWRDKVERLVQVLTPLECLVFDAYLHGGGVLEAGVILGWPRKRVDNALQRIRKKARNFL